MLANRFAISHGPPRAARRHARTTAASIVAVLSRHAERIWVCLFDEDGEREIARLAAAGAIRRCSLRLYPRRHGRRALWPARRGSVRSGARPSLRSGEAAGRSLCDARSTGPSPGIRSWRRRGARRIDTAHLVPKAIVTAPMPQAPRAAAAAAGLHLRNCRQGLHPAPSGCARKRCAAPSRRWPIRR